VNRRRLAYLCLETPREGQATHTHVHEIVNGLIADGWQVELFATSGGGSSSGSSFFRRFFDYCAVQWRLLVKLGRFDALYMRAHFAALPVSLVAALVRKPVVQEINGRPLDILVTYPRLRWFGWLITLCYTIQMRCAARVIAVTEGLCRWARTEGGHDRVSLVTNGANTVLFTPDGPKPPGQDPYIVFLGGLAAWHGIATMVEGARSSAWPHAVSLVIIGDGIERALVQAAADGQRIRWLERLPQAEAAMWLRGAQAALCVIDDPHGRSATGVAPLKLFEAMASGTAVIVSDLPSQADLVRRVGAGVVIPMADPIALARAVATLAADPVAAKAMGSRGADYARAHGSWRARAHETGCLIAEAIDGHA
jgi:glycosyltransferase involved in cell wall biosynthesis